jgi:hypothetical protein
MNFKRLKKVGFLKKTTIQIFINPKGNNNNHNNNNNNNSNNNHIHNLIRIRGGFVSLPETKIK